MSGIVFYFQENDKDVFSGRKVDLDAWRYAMKAGGINEAKIINETELSLSLGGDMNYEIIGRSDQDLVKWVNNNKHNNNIVALSPEWECPYDSKSIYELNNNILDINWFLIGGANGLPKLDIEYVYFPQNGQGAMHSVHVASVLNIYLWKIKSKI